MWEYREKDNVLVDLTQKDLRYAILTVSKKLGLEVAFMGGMEEDLGDALDDDDDL